MIFLGSYLPILSKGRFFFPIWFRLVDTLASFPHSNRGIGRLVV